VKRGPLAVRSPSQLLPLIVLLATVALVAACGRAPRTGPAPEVARPTLTHIRTLVARRLPFPPLDSILSPPPLTRPVRVCAGGDVMLGSNLAPPRRASIAPEASTAPVLPDPNSLLAPLAPLMADADVIMLNVEGAIGEGPASPKCRPDSRFCYAFRQPPEVAEALARLGSPAATVVGNVANNHAMDAGPLGFRATLRHLGLAGVPVTGADTLPTLVAVGGRDTIAFLGFSTFQAGPDARDLEALRRHVARAATRYRVVVSVHAGAEGVDAQRTMDRTETYLAEDRGNPIVIARTAVDAGASLVLGHGPHVLRAVEWVRGSLIAYSLGNLVTYGSFSMVEPLNRGAVLCATIGADGFVSTAELKATVQTAPGRVRPDSTARAVWLVDSLSVLDFPGTGARLEGGPALRRPEPADLPSAR
jgi:hypothetical protein